MFFDKKIKSLVEALKRPEIVGDQQFTGGRSAESRQLHMDESRFKECLFEFESTRNPQVLIDGMHYAYGRGQEVHFKLPRGGNQFTWKGAPDFNKVVYEKYFKKGSKNYIDYPLTDSGNIPDNRSFQAMVASGSYPVLKNNTVTWLKLLEPLLKEFEDKQMIASDRRQQIDTETGERISPDSFFYYIKSPATGKILLKQARVTLTFHYSLHYTFWCSNTIQFP